MTRWAIWIDIEGFSKRYPKHNLEAILPLRELMAAIFDAGRTVYRESPNRIFAHQTGDGFIIVAEFEEQKPNAPIALAIYMMRRVLSANGVAKAAISEGDFGDIMTCYPDSIPINFDDRCAPLGDGLMTFFPVMGTALINAHTLSLAEKGAVLLVDEELLKDRPVTCEFTKWGEFRGFKYRAVDWVNSTMPQLARLEDLSGWESSRAEAIAERIRRYCRSSPRPDRDWIENTIELSGARKWSA